MSLKQHTFIGPDKTPSGGVDMGSRISQYSVKFQGS